MPGFTGKESQTIWLYLDAQAACQEHGSVPPALHRRLDVLREGFLESLASARERLSETEIHEQLTCMQLTAERHAVNGYFMRRIRETLGTDRFESVPMDAYEGESYE